MVRNAGTTNYSAVDIDRLLDIIQKVRPLGKDEWERLTMTFNANRPRGAPERDVDSLRRKFKVLYSTRKPTGVADMPPHILKAKEAKRSIDEKANVIELDDEADVNQRAMDPDFSFDAEPDRSFYEADDPDILHAALNGGHSDGGSTSSLRSEATAVSLRSEDAATVMPYEEDNHAPVRGGFQSLLETPLVAEELGDVPLTPRPTPPTRRPGSTGLPPPRTASNNGNNLPQAQHRSGKGRLVRSHDEIEAEKYPELNSHSNRLGGADLTAFRDSVGSKRARGDDDQETQEASFAKVKRIRATKATNALKAKLEGLESAASNNRGSFFEAILLLREENERKAESRRDEEEQRRRDEKAEAEERRRIEKQEAEDRVRRDREEARARTQEMIMLISALTKKD